MSGGAVLERDLAPPVAAWMRDAGFVVYAEVPYAGRSADLVGLHPDGRVRVVELKRAFAKSLMWQILPMRSCAHELFVAVATNPRRGARWETCEKNGIGVLRVSDTVEVLLPCRGDRRRRGMDTPFPGAVDVLRRMCESVGPGEVAGVPTVRGVGPAQSVCDEVERVRAESPGVTWRELFEAVPNHYCSWQSMRSAVGRVLEARGRSVA